MVGFIWKVWLVMLSHTMKFYWRLMFNNFFQEIIIRAVLLLVFCVLEYAHPFERIIQREELWLYKHPHKEHDTVPTSILFSMAAGVPAAFIIAHFIVTRDRTDLEQGLFGLSLSALLTATILNVIKISVGRPRPDFFYRCFPDGHVPTNLQCSGNPDVIEEGRKSFPSGHTGWMFTCFGFLSLYLCGKLHCFRPAGRAQAWRLCSVLTPLVAATLVGLTRMQDFRHHWEDVLVGGSIGLLIGILCYRHYYPSIFDANCHIPHAACSANPDSPELPLNSSRLNLRKEWH